MSDTASAPSLLAIEDLRIAFPSPTGMIDVVRGVSLSLGRERLAIVGESGSGKSVTMRALLGLAGPSAKVTAGKAQFRGRDLLTMAPAELRALRGRRMAMAVQDARQGLNPMRTVGSQIAEMVRLHRGVGASQAKSAALALLDDVHIRDPHHVARLYAHQISGGMAQRVMIAMMLAGEPDVLIADEITSALDAIVQRRILALLDEQVTRRGMGLILISHDLDLVTDYADRVLVMYAGRVVETLTRAQGFERAVHPYTRGLIACRPSLDRAGGLLPVLNRQEAWLR